MNDCKQQAEKIIMVKQEELPNLYQCKDCKKVFNYHPTKERKDNE